MAQDGRSDPRPRLGRISLALILTAGEALESQVPRGDSRYAGGPGLARAMPSSIDSTARRLPWTKDSTARPLVTCTVCPRFCPRVTLRRCTRFSPSTIATCVPAARKIKASSGIVNTAGSDGTWNTTHDNTNVWRLKSMCTQSSAQTVYYSAGVGTQRGEKISGGTEAASTGRLNAVRRIHRYGMATKTSPTRNQPRRRRARPRKLLRPTALSESAARPAVRGDDPVGPIEWETGTVNLT